MTRISSLLVASALAILPIGAFAQQAAAPAKATAPAAMTAPTNTTAPVAGKTAATSMAPTSMAPTATANSTQPAKPDAKAPVVGTKNQVHGMNTVKTHHAKASVPAKTV
jgi:hypothetical protein